ELAREIVSVQFGDKHPPALVPTHRRWRSDERLAGDDLHAKTVGQFERGGAFLGSQGLGRVGWFRNLRNGEIGSQQHGPGKPQGFEDGSAGRRQKNLNQFVRGQNGEHQFILTIEGKISTTDNRWSIALFYSVIRLQR